MSSHTDVNTERKCEKDTVNGTIGVAPSELLPDNYPTVIQKYTSYRWRLGYMVFLAFVLVQATQNSMAFGVVCMTGMSGSHVFNETVPQMNSTSVSLNITSGHKSIQKGEFDYSSETQGLLISSVQYLGIISPIIGGFLSRRFGPKIIILISMLITGSMMMIMPVAARTHVYVAVLCRIILGFASNMVCPASLDFWYHWAPLDETAQLVAYSFNGYNIATVVSFALSGYLCLIPVDNGWPFLFYVFGGFTLLWCMVWHLVIYETPENHPRITDKEKVYITKTRRPVCEDSQKLRIPWKKMAQSKGIWAFILLEFFHNWNTIVLFGYLPSYMASVLKFDYTKNGLLSSLPYISRVLGTILFAHISVKLVRIMTVTNIRKLFQSGGFSVAAGLMIALCFLEEGQEYTAVGILILGTPFQSAYLNGAIVTPLDMAPQFAAIITSIGNSWAYVAMMTSPMVVSVIVKNRTREEWSYVFYMSGGIFLLGAVVFLLMGSAELQPWADTSSDTLGAGVSQPTETNGHVNVSYASDNDEDTTPWQKGRRLREDDISKSANNKGISNDFCVSNKDENTKL